MEKIATWFLDRAKPGFMSFSKFIGVIAICLGLTYVISGFIKSDIFYQMPVIIFFGILFLGFTIDIWAKGLIIEKAICEFIDESESDNCEKIIHDGNLIDYPQLNGIISRVKNNLRENGYYDEKFIGYGDSSVEEINKKIDELIRHKYYEVKHANKKN